MWKSCVAIVLTILAAGCGPADEAEPMSTLATGEGRFEGAGGLRLFYRTLAGPGEPVVVVHGGPGCDSAYLEPDLGPLSELRAVVYYDQRGGGRSELPEDVALLAIGHHVADLERLRTHLGLERLTLLAHSYGPLLAASYAIAHPDRVERMVFIGPLPPRRGDVWTRIGRSVEEALTPEENEQMRTAWKDLLEGADPVEACRRFWAIGMKPRVADPAKIPLVKGDLCAAAPEAIRYAMAKTNPETLASLGDWDLRERLAAVTAPTLIIHGERETIPMDLVEEWTTALPDARLLRVPEAAHFPHVERPDVVWPAIEAFLSPNQE